METDKVTEKVYCYDHPSAYHNDNALIGAIMSAGQNKGCSCADMMAMMNNQNGWNNNPFIWLVFLAWMNGGMGFGNRADVAQNADLARQLQTLQGTVVDNNNNQLALNAINGNRDALGQLAQTFNTDITSMQNAICSVKSAIEQVGGAVGYTGESVKNAIALGDSNIIQQMQNCCCQQKEIAIRGNYENQLATERQTNILGSQMASNHAADQLQDCQNHGSLMSRIDQLANGIQSGFAQIGFNQQQNTQAIIQNATQNTQRILDQMCANTTQELRDKLADSDRALQTQTIINQLKSSGCSCGCN